MPRLIHIGMQIISAWLYKYAYKIMPHMWKNVKTCIIMSKNIIGKIRIMDNEKLLINIKEAGKRAAKILLIFVFCLFYRCPFKLFLHIECPGCGMTRAVISVLKLNFRQAFQYHPLFPIVLLGGLYYVFRSQFRKWLHIGSRQEDIMLTIAGLIFLIRWIWIKI